MDFRTPLARAIGLGSAKTGTSHWLLQRVTAVALVPLSLPLIKLIKLCLTEPYRDTVTWLAEPFNSVCIIAWILAVFYHAALGMQVVVEDYVAKEGAKIAAIWAINLSFLFLALTALLAVLRIILVG